LLIEVRKLQNAIQEKEEIIKRLEASRAESERHYETSQRHLRQREEVEGIQIRKGQCSSLFPLLTK
jgi:hypothetical protein